MTGVTTQGSIDMFRRDTFREDIVMTGTTHCRQCLIGTTKVTFFTFDLIVIARQRESRHHMIKSVRINDDRFGMCCSSISH